MHSGKRWSWGGWRTSARAGLMTAPFLIAALGLLIKVPPEVQFFSGGPLVAWNSLCLAVLAPYVAIAFVGMGALLVNRLDEGNDLDAADLLVLQFFGGAALCVLIGVCLGAAGLLFPWITIPFLTGIIALAPCASIPWPLDTIYGCEVAAGWTNRFVGRRASAGEGRRARRDAR
ncbi:hypothetical protein ABH973_007120 [Bradyrhizobium ottawaense]|uniref:hypothetical protein n=1 Tax=Bradyrhizobium ottawaense TaxID=931866 RepID=UPI00351820AD